MIHQYKSEGLSNRAIERRLGIDCKSVVKRICQGEQDSGALQPTPHPAGSIRIERTCANLCSSNLSCQPDGCSVRSDGSVTRAATQSFMITCAPFVSGPRLNLRFDSKPRPVIFDYITHST